jgi:hypothetical protein
MRLYYRLRHADKEDRGRKNRVSRYDLPDVLGGFRLLYARASKRLQNDVPAIRHCVAQNIRGNRGAAKMAQDPAPYDQQLHFFKTVCAMVSLVHHSCLFYMGCHTDFCFGRYWTNKKLIFFSVEFLT